MKKTLSAVSFAVAGALFAGGAVAQSNNIGLPGTLAWSAYDVGSGGYNQAVAIGNAFKQKYGTNLRVLPGKNDVSRTLPLREGKVQFSANGVGGSYMAQEGFYDFGTPNWGPQPVRALLLNNSDQVLTAVAAGDAGVNTPADLKGKRVAWVIGAPSLNQNITAILAFANLTWDDVQKVEFGGFGAAMDGVANGQADAAFTSSISGKAYALEKSPRGIQYPVMDPNNTEGWKRLQAIAPFFYPANGTEGAGISKEKPAVSASYPYPVLMTYADQDPKLAKAVVTAMVDTFDMYKDAAPGNVGWGMDRQKLEWVIPYHDGAIAYFKEKGVWTDAHQKNNDMLVKRQQILADAWKAVKARSHANDQEFAKDWMKTRAEALTKAGMDPVMTSW
ncbi:TAXI family TRAP transporter solute-binding subunit [Orrella daihaiensis]|uniref:TAXI family TRAP transporter solute-binding subunit n=1 Tax=Orrella daihaiensis TaxID=2782176 RepID=A0ABY4AGR5_9BURK|nr:TAXI family TRAP transporter solute-binding subunit [Orrella daihaiensis]UOD49471.1 TAXI family TRAP transporter solute-binding subunit [Orrella daihaiensis]